MAFTVEDGTGLTNANAYLSVADFRAYHADRGNVLPDGTGTAQIEDAIVRATDYIDRRFRHRFIGRRKEIDRAGETAQRLEWPRINARDMTGAYLADDSIPIEIEEACAEYAFRALSGTLTVVPTVGETGALISETTIIGPIEETIEYAQGGQPVAFRAYPEIDSILRGLVIPGGGAIRG